MEFHLPTNACRICFDYTDDISDLEGGKGKTLHRSAGTGCGRRNKRIGALVDVKHQCITGTWDQYCAHLMSVGYSRPFDKDGRVIVLRRGHQGCCIDRKGS